MTNETIDANSIRENWISQKTTKIESKEDLNKYIQIIKDIDNVNMTIETKPVDLTENTIMLFDNEDINSAFLHEEFIKFQNNLDTYEKAKEAYSTITEDLYEQLRANLQTTRVVYCSNNQLINETFADLFKAMTSINDFKPPVITFYNKESDKVVLIEFEIFDPITHLSFYNIYSIIDNPIYFQEQEL